MEFDPEALPVPDLGLKCKNCGYPLGGLSLHRCPECGRTFTLKEYIPRGDAPRVIFGAREVRLTPEILELMERSGIPLAAESSTLEKLVGLDALAGKSRWLTVPRAYYFHAIEALRRYAQTGRLPSPLTETPMAEGREWGCSHCGESNPGTFELCWHCGRPGPGVA